MKKSDINPMPQYFNRYKASAKIRTGNPVDDAEDYTIDVWADWKNCMYLTSNRKIFYFGFHSTYHFLPKVRIFSSNQLLQNRK